MRNHVFSGDWCPRIFPAQSTSEECYVYWIFDNTCQNPEWHGYIGVTTKKRYKSRCLEHKRSNRFSKDCSIRIIFEGNIEGCYLYEAVLRPYPNMGWNIAAGGARGHKIGNKKSDETKKKIGVANFGRKRPDLAERNRTYSPRKQEIYCIRCRAKVTFTKLSRGHKRC